MTDPKDAAATDNFGPQRDVEAMTRQARQHAKDAAADLCPACAVGQHIYLDEVPHCACFACVCPPAAATPTIPGRER